MFSTKKMIDCWRYGQLQPLYQRLLYLGIIMLTIIPFLLLLDNDQFTLSRLALIDVLLGLPLILALYLTILIVWQGIIKSIACLLNGMTLVDRNDMPQEQDETI